MKTNQFSTFITHDKVNDEYNRLASSTVSEHVSSFRESSVSVCVEGTVAITETKQFLFLNILTLFVLDNKGNNKITELRTILQRESQNS